MYMIMYNTLMSVAAGVGLLMVVALGKKLWKRTAIAAEGWSLTFGIVGVILTGLGAAVSITWPYKFPGAIDANIMFGEPAIAFGLLLLAASFYLWQHRELFGRLNGSKAESDQAFEQILRVVKPVSVFVFATGLIMTACAIAWVRYRLGAAPSVEPISGLFSDQPVLESTFLGVLYGLVAVGALLFPFGIHNRNKNLLTVIAVCWVIAGLVFLAFGALNYYTHIGMLVNTTSGGHYRF